MKFLEDIFTGILEFLGFEAAEITFGELFPGALIGFVLAAWVGGKVSDARYNHSDKEPSIIPWEWITSIVVFILSIVIYGALVFN